MERFLLVLKNFTVYTQFMHIIILKTYQLFVFMFYYKEIYVELSSKLKSTMLSELKLKTKSIDFGQSKIQTMELVFVDINIQFCYYHLS